MMELLGPMPKSFPIAGKQFENFFTYDEFTGKYTYKKIQGLQFFPLKKLLIDKYRLKIVEADRLADFLLRILKWNLKDRASAQELLDHDWLSMPDEYNYKMTDLEYKKYKLKSTIEQTNEDFLLERGMGGSSGKKLGS
jgi:serine/threonine-protein kinase SRPK3